MACDTFSGCISDPLVGTSAADNFKDLSTTAIFSINLALFIFYSLLIVSVVYFMFKGVYSIIGADSSEAYEKFQGAVTNAVFAAIGLVLLVSARFLFVQTLILIGIPDPENVFMNLPF